MGRISNVDKAKIAERYGNVLDTVSETLVRSGRFVVEEGFTIGMGVMLWRLSGRVNRHDKDGNPNPAWELRDEFINALQNIRENLVLPIPILNIAPFGWTTYIIRYYENLLVKMVPGTQDWAEVPFVERLELITIIPGAFRTILEVLKGVMKK